MATEVTEQGGADRRPAPRRRSRRWLVGLILAVVVLASAGVYYYAFGNVAMHGSSWVARRIDGGIRRGLDYLHETGTFGKHVEEGGEPPPHHFFLERVLDLGDHAGLRAQMNRGRQVNQDHREWRMYLGMPGWPRPRLSPLERRLVQHAVVESPENPYAAWLVYSLYPDWTELPETERQRLFVDTGRLTTSYDLTHALLAYLWLHDVAPGTAADLKVDRLIEAVSDRLYRIHTWDPRTSDIYNERVAFWLYMEDGPPVRARWIERILLSQNPDGGWTFDPSIARTLKQMVGLGGHDAASDPHPTFLALFALTQYREWLRAEGLYPAG
jgi:hypothetical protein